MIEIGPKSSKIVALEITIWGQYRANYKVAGAPSASVLNAGLWSHAPPCTPQARRGHLAYWAPLFAPKLAARNRPEPVAAGKNRLQPYTATTLGVGWFSGMFLNRFLPLADTNGSFFDHPPRR